MRDAAFLIALLVAACSANHVVVATLDEATPGGAGGAAGTGPGSGGLTETATTGGATFVATGGAAGTSGGSSSQGGAASTGGAVSTGGASSVSDGFFILGGSEGIKIGAAGAEGDISGQTVCSCFGQKTRVCGRDGVDYDTACPQGEICVLPAIECWHACPCVDDEPDSMLGAAMIPLDCVPTSECADGFVCMTHSSSSKVETNCP